MRIAYVTAGAAGMYCGSCLHDNTLAAALQRAGHDVALIPVYTPIRTDETDVSVDRVFYGAIQVYLEQKSALFAHLPRPLERLLAHPRLLAWVAGRATAVDPRALGELTLSMLRGEEGRQRRDLARLVEWLVEFRPDVVHLTNSMLLGLARPIRRATGAPVLCSVQGEDLFFDSLAEPWRSQVLDLLRRRAADADWFVSTSEYYVEPMAARLGLGRERIDVVHLGIRLEDLTPREPTPRASGAVPEFVVGYLARICPEKGLHLLVEAFALLAAARGPERVRLEVAGYLGAKDGAYLERVREQIARAGLAARVRLRGEVDRAGKAAFLRGLDVLSVPTVYREPKGLFVLEALAAAVPVVQPRHGAFPELIEATGGGLLVEPDSAPALAAALGALADDPARGEALGRRGRAAVEAAFSDAAMARRTVEVYARQLALAATA